MKKAASFFCFVDFQFFSPADGCSVACFWSGRWEESVSARDVALESVLFLNGVCFLFLLNVIDCQSFKKEERVQQM